MLGRSPWSPFCPSMDRSGSVHELWSGETRVTSDLRELFPAGRLGSRGGRLTRPTGAALAKLARLSPELPADRGVGLCPTAWCNSENPAGRPRQRLRVATMSVCQRGTQGAPILARITLSRLKPGSYCGKTLGQDKRGCKPLRECQGMEVMPKGQTKALLPACHRTARYPCRHKERHRRRSGLRWHRPALASH